MKEIIDYIISWLCYGDEEAAARVAYTADETALDKYDVIIVPNGLLGKELVLPGTAGEGQSHHPHGHRV